MLVLRQNQVIKDTSIPFWVEPLVAIGIVKNEAQSGPEVFGPAPSKSEAFSCRSKKIPAN